MAKEVAKSKVRDDVVVSAFDDGSVALTSAINGAVIVAERDDVPQFVKGVVAMYGEAQRAHEESHADHH